MSEFFGVGVGVEKKIIFGNRSWDQNRKKNFSESQSGFEIEKCDSADQY